LSGTVAVLGHRVAPAPNDLLGTRIEHKRVLHARHVPTGGVGREHECRIDFAPLRQRIGHRAILGSGQLFSG
jgi:hypothetical protein